MTTTDKQRYLAIDVMRGLTLIGMIIVNDPGSWDHVFPPLLHAEWNGLTPTDYVYPFFLFIIGVSIALAYQPKIEMEEPKNKMVTKIFLRTLKIFGLGVFLWLFPSFDLTISDGLVFYNVLPSYFCLVPYYFYIQIKNSKFD